MVAFLLPPLLLPPLLLPPLLLLYLPHLCCEAIAEPLGRVGGLDEGKARGGRQALEEERREGAKRHARRQARP